MSTVSKIGVQSLIKRCKSNQAISNFRTYFHTDSSFGNEPSINNLIYNVFLTPGKPTLFDCRKYGHNLPEENCECSYPFETLPCIPRGVFRCTAGEKIGAGADKSGCYRNPEYFSFHHSSFFDLHLHLRPYRLPSPNPNKKP